MITLSTSGNIQPNMITGTHDSDKPRLGRNHVVVTGLHTVGKVKENPPASHSSASLLFRSCDDLLGHPCWKNSCQKAEGNPMGNISEPVFTLFRNDTPSLSPGAKLLF